MFNKIFGFFSSKSSEKVEIDLLDVHQQNLEQAKKEDAALKEFEAKRKEEEQKLLERKAKFKSIEQELERTFDSMTKGARRVRKIEKRIAALRDEEQENLQQHFDKAAELRRRFEASLWEEDDDKEETPPVAPVPVVNPNEEEQDNRPKTPKYELKNRGSNPEVK